MRNSSYLNYTKTSLIFFAIGAGILVFITITNSTDIISATLLLISANCLIGGILFLAFSKKEPIESRIANLFVVGIIDTCQLCSTLSIQGNAHFIFTDKSVMQYIPIRNNFKPQKILKNCSFLTDKESCYISSPPTAVPLLTLLHKEHNLIIPNEERLLFQAIKEVFEDGLEVAEKVDVRHSDEMILADLHNYSFFDSCVSLQNVSPNCCAMAPCPACSLIASMLSEGLKQPITIQQVVLENLNRTIHITFSLRNSEMCTLN
jgi:hypothetical protein